MRYCFQIVAWSVGLFALLSAGGLAYAQGSFFETTVGTDDEDRALRATPLPGGDILVGGMQRVKTIGFGGQSIYTDNALQITRLDPYGQGIWMRQFTGPSMASFTTQDFAFDTLANRVYAAARIGQNDLYLAAFDTAGNFLWGQHLQGQRYNVVRLAVLANGDIAIGYLDGPGVAPHLSVFNPQGQWQYTRRFEQYLSVMPNLTLCARPNGGVYFAFSVYDWVNIDDVVVTAINATGDVDWASQYGSAAAERPTAIAVTPTGDIVIVGTTDAETATEWLGINRDIWLLTLRPTGNVHISVSYRRVLRGPNGAIWTHYPEAVRGIAIGLDSTAVLTGLVDYYEGYIDTYVLKVKPYFAEVLRHTRGGGLSHDQGFGVAALPDSGFILLGELKAYTYEQYVVRTGPNIELEPCFAEPAQDQFEIQVLTNIDRTFSALDAQPRTSAWAAVAFTEIPVNNFLVIKQDVDMLTEIIPETCPDSNNAQIRLTGIGQAPFTHFMGPVNSPSLFPRQQDSVFHPVAAGTYLVAVANANGCTVRDTVTVIDLPPYQFSIADTDAVVCFGDSLLLTATASGATPPFTFLLSDGQALAGDSVAFAPVSAGAYQFTVLDQNGCPKYADFTVASHPEIVMGLPDTFTLPTGPFDNNRYTLTPAQPAGGQWAGLYIADANLGIWVPPIGADTGTFTVSYSLFGCEDNRPVVMQEPPGTPLMPSAFSPNGDGINDVLTLPLPRHTAFSFEIWDRWAARSSTPKTGTPPGMAPKTAPLCPKAPMPSSSPSRYPKATCCKNRGR